MHTFGVKLLFFPTLAFLFPLFFSTGIVGNFGDIYQYAAPFRHFAKTSLQEGCLPLWNPYLFSGTPFLASPQSALFYPLSTLFYFLPLNYAFNYAAIGHIFLSALGMLLLLTSLKYSSSTSMLGSCIWGFSFFMLTKLAAGHIIHLSSYSWFCWVLLFAVRLENSNPQMRNLILLLLASALQFFSGHLQVWALTTGMLFLIFFWRILFCDPSQKVFQAKIFSIYLICFFALSAIQFLPSLIYLLHSTRTILEASKESAYIFATSYSMQWKDLLTLLLPNYFGNPIDRNYVDPLHPSIYFETQTIYFGILPLFFSIGGILLSLKRKKFFLPILILFFTLLSMGKNSFLYNWIWEMLAFLRVPARFFFLSFFALVLCALCFWEGYFQKMNPKLKFAILLVLLLDLWGNGKKFIWTENPMEKIGRTQVLDWLQAHLPSLDAGSSHRIFTTAEIGNPNKTMFYRIANVNGYEAILQKRLLSYFAASQGLDSVLTTGVDLKNPENLDFKFFSVKYIVSTYNFQNSQMVKEYGDLLKIYQAPHSFPPAFLEPSSQLPRLDRSSPNKISLSFVSHPHSAVPTPTRLREERQNLMLTAIASRQDAVEGKVPSEKLFLSEAYYPGWQAFSESGKKLKPHLWKGYFQMLDLTSLEKAPEKIYCAYSLKGTNSVNKMDPSNQKLQLPTTNRNNGSLQVSKHKIYFLFSPLDFKIGSWLSLVSFLFITIYFLVPCHREHWLNLIK